MGKWGAECLVWRGRGRGYPDTLVGEMSHSMKVTNAILYIFRPLGNLSFFFSFCPPRPERLNFMLKGAKDKFKRPQDF